MILFLDTSTPTCRLAFTDGEWRHEAQWEAHRELAKGLLGFIEAELQGQQKSFEDITAIAAYRGPGSFTGLRIGLTVCNTLADALHMPIVGATSESWQEEAKSRLSRGDNDQLVMPLYGNDANITTPRK